MSDRPRAMPGAMTEHFDIARVRRNWERARSPEPATLPHRFAEVQKPRDAVAFGHEQIARVRALANTRFAARASMLAPFFAQADAALARIAAASAGEDTTVDREALIAVLGDLEDLFEVFAEIGR